MPISDSEYKEKLEAALSPDVMKSLMLAVATGYRSSFEHCKRHLEKPDRHDAIGYFRRVKIHEAVRGVGERFKIESKDEPNCCGSTFFLSLFSGEFRLVCNLVSTPSAMVRPAKIRRVWARYNFSPQHDLPFNPSAVSDSKAVGHRLCILIHAPRGRHRDEPGFTDIVVPDTSLSAYVTRIQLFERFSTVIEENPTLFKSRRQRGDNAANSAAA